MGKWNELFHYSKNLFTTLGGNYTDFIFSEHLFMADSSMFMVSEIDLSLSFSVAKATLELQMSVRPSVTKTTQPLRILSICHYAYILISKMFYLISQIPQISVLILISKIFYLISQIFQISVHQSITKTPQPLRIAPINHRTY